MHGFHPCFVQRPLASRRAVHNSSSSGTELVGCWHAAEGNYSNSIVMSFCCCLTCWTYSCWRWDPIDVVLETLALHNWHEQHFSPHKACTYVPCWPSTSAHFWSCAQNGATLLNVAADLGLLDVVKLHLHGALTSKTDNVAIIW